MKASAEHQRWMREQWEKESRASFAYLRRRRAERGRVPLRPLPVR